jgi:hypothetical protein
MKIIDVRDIQNEEGRRKTYKQNWYIHPNSRYLGHCGKPSVHTMTGRTFGSSCAFIRETKKLFTLNKPWGFKWWGYGENLSKSASNCRKWYGIKIPSTGWKKVQFIYHEPLTFRKDNPIDTDAHFLKFLLKQL